MNGTISVEIKKNDFQKIANEMPRRTSAVVKKAAFDILAHSVPNTPVDTGFLRNSASVSFGNTEASVFWAAHYAIYQEFGTRYIAPKLFATGAAAHVGPQFVKAMEAMLQQLS